MIPSIRVNINITKSNYRLKNNNNITPKRRIVNNISANHFTSPWKRNMTTMNNGFTEGTEVDENITADSMEQTNLHGRQSSTLPSGHSYGTSDIKYSQYAGQDEKKTQATNELESIDVMIIDAWTQSAYASGTSNTPPSFQAPPSVEEKVDPISDISKEA